MHRKHVYIPVKNSLHKFIGRPHQLLLLVFGDRDLMFCFHVNPHLVHNKSFFADEAPCLDCLLHVIAQLDPLHVVLAHVPLHHLPIHLSLTDDTIFWNHLSSLAVEMQLRKIRHITI